MHSIERYGIVALIFLVVTVVAVLMWDGGKDKKKPQELAGASGAAAQPQLDQPAANDAARRLALQARSQPGPLVRHPRAAQLAAEAGVELQPQAGAPLVGTDPLTPEGAPLEAESDLANGLGTSGTPSEQPAPELVVGQAPPSLQPLTPAATTTRAYVVRAGDTLSHIAQKELGSAKRWNEILKVNPGLEPAKLRSGKTIQLPGAAGAASLTAAVQKGAGKEAPATSAKSTAKSTPPAPKTGGARTHTVGKGENLWKIAERTLGDGKRWKEIADLNPGLKADRLLLGQKLKLPGGAPAAGGSGAKKAAPRVAAQAPKGDTRVASVVGAERSTRGGKVK